MQRLLAWSISARIWLPLVFITCTCFCCSFYLILLDAGEFQWSLTRLPVLVSFSHYCVIFALQQCSMHMTVMTLLLALFPPSFQPFSLSLFRLANENLLTYITYLNTPFIKKDMAIKLKTKNCDDHNFVIKSDNNVTVMEALKTLKLKHKSQCLLQQ